MWKNSPGGFTLLEILTVIVIILIIAGWIVAQMGPSQKRAARIRAEGDIKVMAAAMESYKADFGGYPRMPLVTETDQPNGTSPIDPRKDGNPKSAAYQNASAFLYKSLSGDMNQDGVLSPPGEPSKSYVHFEDRMLKVERDGSGKVTRVDYLLDPFGNCFGYSTAGARAEDDLRAAVATSGNTAARAAQPVGYNPTFDLWSTAGEIITGQPADADRNTWVKNW